MAVKSLIEKLRRKSVANQGEVPQHPSQHSWAERIIHNRLLSWATLFLAVSSYILTIVYIWHSNLVCRHTIFGHSPASALATANVLSWTANMLLSASIGQSLDLMRAMLIARERGHFFLDNLPLQSGTGIDGLLEIFWNWNRFGRHQPGAWSIFRLMTMVIVPVLGIVVLSNVEAIPTYFQQTTQNITRGYGIGPFNASLATLLQPMADAFFGTRFKDFLSDQDLVVNVSNSTDTAGCSSGLLNDPRGTCRAQYFVPGGIEQFAPRLLVGSAFTTGGNIQPVLAKNLTGYYLQFEANNETQFDPQVDCRKYGYGLLVSLSFLSGAQTDKSTDLRPCPKSLAVNLQCMDNTTWPTDGGWGTTLEVNTRPADVIYNGLNGTILDLNFLSDTLSPVNITAPVLLDVFNVLFSTSNNTSKYGQALAAIGIGSNKPVEPFIIWQYFQGLAELAKNDTRANEKAQVGLQSLLTIPIYHCQAKDFAEMRHLLLEQIDNTTSIVHTLGLDIVNQFPIVAPDTDIFPAILRYSLQVGKASLVAYIVLAGITLLLCLIATSLASCTALGRKFRHMGPFPALTQLCDCKIVNRNGTVVSSDDFQRYGEGEVLLMTAGMYLHLVEKDNFELTSPDVSSTPAENPAATFLSASALENGMGVRRSKSNKF
ncbi:hypothetical protein EG329_013410 [Mollisiaceae sp. DMI_Dod_QoI]|nr:hypothetical protein EG329_013410 [Helotiales sp. DMI_Dod_QoI]